MLEFKGKTNKKEYIIGVDIGRANVKTSKAVFENSVEEGEFSQIDNVVEYADKKYKIGESIKNITLDATADEDAFILTLKGIAMELKSIGMSVADVILAVGTDYVSYIADKDKVREYYSRGEVTFSYEDKMYSVNIIRVMVFPQGFACMVDFLRDLNKGEIVTIDVGSKTVDCIAFRDGVIIENESQSLTEFGILDLVEKIRRLLYSDHKKDHIANHHIYKVMNSKDYILFDEKITLGIHKILSDYVECLIGKLGEKYNMELNDIIFCGGAAKMIQEYGSISENWRFHDNICANASGFEILAKNYRHMEEFGENA